MLKMCSTDSGQERVQPAAVAKYRADPGIEIQIISRTQAGRTIGSEPEMAHK